MNLLLDTHVWLWCLEANPRLAEEHANLIRDGRNRIYLSVVSYWEVSIKRSLGKISVPDQLLPATSEQRMEWLPVELIDVLALDELPIFHRDPFDRILISQARARNLTLLSSDKRLTEYDGCLDLRIC